MRTLLIALAILLGSDVALAQQTASPCYWQGQLVKCFPTTGIYLDGNRSLRLGETTANGTNYVELISPTSLGSNYVLTMPAATDTLVGKATSDTLTNKTIDADGTGNSISNIENADIKAAAAIDGSKIVSATNAVSGVVTTAAQSVAGLKTFYDGIELDDDADQDALDYYRTEAISASSSSGNTACFGSGSVTGDVTRTGNVVTLTFYVTSGGTTGSTIDTIFATTVVPAWAQPADTVYTSIPYSWPNEQFIWAYIGADGSVGIRADDSGARWAFPASTISDLLTISYKASP